MARTYDDRESRLVGALQRNHEGVVLDDFRTALAVVGLRDDDPRLRRTMDELSGVQGEGTISPDRVRQSLRHSILLMERALQGRLVIPDFSSFKRRMSTLFDQLGSERSGTPADYIPQLRLEGSELNRFGVAVCSVDGQRASWGDAGAAVTVQSCHKPINYCLALEEHGPEFVHRHIGREPSGVRFNEITLDRENRPHNPMVNAGAIMTAALVQLSQPRELGYSGERFDYVSRRWQTLCGGERPGFDNAVYLSERATADRNMALGYLMREKGIFPPGADLQDTLDFYFQCCSMSLNAEQLSVVASTLANGGVCPLTGDRVFSPSTVQSCLSMMASCGMYDYSGEFAFRVGLPGKSSVSGIVMLVVPGLMGIASYSPRLDEVGNSVRGVRLTQNVAKSFDLHPFSGLSGSAVREDPRVDPIQRRAEEVNRLVWAASRGDLGALQQYAAASADVNCADYDGRTPLHLAASEGQHAVVRFFVDRADDAVSELSPRDRWGGTPLDDACQHGHDEVVQLLEAAGAKPGSRRSTASRHCAATTDTPRAEVQADEVIWAAALGDVSYLRRMKARGLDLDAADYDERTPLHLAAAEGRFEAVSYLLTQGVEPAPRDRWGNTPAADARRGGHERVLALLESSGADRDGRERIPAAQAA